MKKRTKTITIGLICVVVGVAATLIGQSIISFATDIFGPPHVTIINTTGDDITQVAIIIGGINHPVSNLKDRQTITIPIYGQFGESSTRIAWTDTMGRHDEKADDYLEDYGFYHTQVVLTPERKATAVYEKP